MKRVTYQFFHSISQLFLVNTIENSGVEGFPCIVMCLIGRLGVCVKGGVEL